MSLGLIVGQSPKGVALLFKKYGINAPVSEESLKNALIVYKRPFADELYDLVINADFSASDGTDQKDKFADILNQNLGLLTGIYTILTGKTLPGVTTDPAAPEVKKEDPKPVKMWLGIPVALWVGIAIILILIIILMLVKNK